MSNDKVTDNLKNYLQNCQPVSNIEVIIELAPSSNHLDSPGAQRTEKIELRKKSFLQETESVTELIRNQGGDVLDSLWLNKTVKAKIPANCIPELTRLKEVNVIDLSHQIKRD